MTFAKDFHGENTSLHIQSFELIKRISTVTIT